MSTYLPPSKTPVSELQIARFNHLYRKIHARLAPGTPEEISLANEIVVGLWHHRSNRSRAQALEKQLRQMRPGVDEAARIEAVRSDLAFHLRHSKLQKNFAWRRRNKFFDMKTIREQQERMPLAA
jgi:hypothetical protein